MTSPIEFSGLIIPSRRTSPRKKKKGVSFLPCRSIFGGPRWRDLNALFACI